jgi:hypothetical protein
VTAVLLPGAAVFVQPAYACQVDYDFPPQEQRIAESQLIVIGQVVEQAPALLVVRPEAFLKGPASGEDIRFEGEYFGCPLSAAVDGDRALIFVDDASQPTVPLVTDVYVLREGRAQRGETDSVSEVQLVNEIRAITEQYAVPAASESEGAGIDWQTTVLPLGAALAIVFVIGLALMRVWHRIDPS